MSVKLVQSSVQVCMPARTHFQVEGTAKRSLALVLVQEKHEDIPKSPTSRHVDCTMRASCCPVTLQPHVPAITMSHRNVPPHVSINEVACCRPREVIDGEPRIQ